MNIKVERDEKFKIVDVLVNGKPVKRGSIRGIKKAQETFYWNEFTTAIIGRNPLSGAEIELTPLEGSIYNWCMQWYNRYSYNDETGAPIQTFDDMKYFLLELNPTAYMELLD